jgi:hypothetical protein
VRILASAYKEMRGQIICLAALDQRLLARCLLGKLRLGLVEVDDLQVEEALTLVPPDVRFVAVVA